MRALFNQFRRLIAILVSAPGGKFNLLMFAVIVMLELGSVYATVRIVAWTAQFYSAIEKVDGSAALYQIGVFAVIVALNSARHLIAEYLRKTLELRWRASLTDTAIDMWLTGKAYWHLAQGQHGIDNPDQRIADDCRLFVKGLLGELLDLISRIVGLFSYVALLWQLSNFPLSLSFIGLNAEIPHYMVWAAFLYVALSSGLTHALGHPLKHLYVQQQHREADFRYAMARWRTAFDEVALTNGEQAERRSFREKFAAVADNWHRLIKRELVLGSFTFPFNHTVLRIPLFVALPGYFAGHVAFGGLMQLSMAFSSVVTTLSWFIFSYDDLSSLVSTASRLDGFLQAASNAGSPLPVVSSTSKVTHLRDLRISTPQGRQLLDITGFDIAAGQTVWLRGPSGIGKTTFVKALAGFWPYRDGDLTLGAGAWMFLPQKPWFPSGSLIEAVAYPEPVDRFDRTLMHEALSDVGLSRPDHEKADRLSGGEMQRLSLARLLVHQPQWAVLDEATSALDIKAETELLELLRHKLPETALLVISHRDPAALGPRRVIDLEQQQMALRTA